LDERAEIRLLAIGPCDGDRQTDLSGHVGHLPPWVNPHRGDGLHWLARAVHSVPAVYPGVVVRHVVRPGTASGGPDVIPRRTPARNQALERCAGSSTYPPHEPGGPSPR
jgi:hypothetical protein